MAIKSISLAFAVLVLSTSVNATIITHGNLTTDDTTNYITDTTTGRMYTRFDAFNLSYADTLIAVSPGEIFDGWSIATGDVADDFYNAALGVSFSACDGITPYGTSCGIVSGWNDGDFGQSYDTRGDYFAFEDVNVGAEPIGLGSIWNGNIVDYEQWGNTDKLDRFGDTTGTGDPNVPINLMLYKDRTVPEPSILALMCLGLSCMGICSLKNKR